MDARSFAFSFATISLAGDRNFKMEEAVLDVGEKEKGG